MEKTKRKKERERKKGRERKKERKRKKEKLQFDTLAKGDIPSISSIGG
jgi:hypothetical protein